MRENANPVIAQQQSPNTLTIDLAKNIFSLQHWFHLGKTPKLSVGDKFILGDRSILGGENCPHFSQSLLRGKTCCAWAPSVPPFLFLLFSISHLSVVNWPKRDWQNWSFFCFSSGFSHNCNMRLLLLGIHLGICFLSTDIETIGRGPNKTLCGYGARGRWVHY